MVLTLISVYAHAQTNRLSDGNIQSSTSQPTVNANIIKGKKILFREDFGGNELGAPNIKKTPIANVPYLKFGTYNFYPGGTYYIRRWVNMHRLWMFMVDHTNLDSPDTGYMMIVDGPDETSVSPVIYEFNVKNKNNAKNFAISLWAANIDIPQNCGQANLVLKIKADGNDIKTIDLGEVPRAETPTTWTQFIATFALSESAKILTISIEDSFLGYGNDFVLDDIEVFEL